jgi:hypothetical protein
MLKEDEKPKEIYVKKHIEKMVMFKEILSFSHEPATQKNKIACQ